MRTTIFLTLTLASPVAWSQTIRSVDLRDRVWTDTCLGSVETHDGLYRRDPAVADRNAFHVEAPTYGDLDGDGQDEAIVVSQCVGAGPSLLSNAWVFALREGRAVEVARLGEGDRADGGIAYVAIHDGVIVEGRHVTEHLPTDYEYLADHRRALRDGHVLDLEPATVRCGAGTGDCERLADRDGFVRFDRGREDATRLMTFDRDGRLPALTLRLRAGQVLDVDAWCRGTAVASVRVTPPVGPAADDRSATGRVRVHAARGGVFRVEVRAWQSTGYCYARLAAPATGPRRAAAVEEPGADAVAPTR